MYVCILGKPVPRLGWLGNSADHSAVLSCEMRKSVKRSMRVLAAAGATAALVLAPAAAASALTIETPGPLVRIDISETLNCAVNHAGDHSGEFFADTACGTFATVGGELFGPASVPAGPSSQTAWTPLEQTQGGAGTEADPYYIATTVTGGGLQVQQTDSYVAGAHHYATASVVTNTSEEDVEVTLYHAADCYLGDDDYGFGAYDPATGAVSCVAPDNEGQPSAASRIEQFIPLSTSSNYLYASYSAVWAAVESMQPLPNELRNPNVRMDNGMGLSWTVTIPAGESVPFALQTNFSPLDVTTLTTSLAIDPASVLLDGEATVTARIDNPNDTAQDLSSATITLPAGVEYVAGSAIGIAEPVVDAGQLLFDGAGAEIAPDGSLQFTFRVTSSTAGVYSLGLAAAVESRVDVTPSSAQLNVGLPQLPTLLSFDPESVTVGERSTLVGGVINEHAVDFTLSQLVLTLPEGAAYVPGSADGIVEPVVDGRNLVFAGPINLESNAMLPFIVEIETSAAGAQVFSLAGTAEGATVVTSETTLTVVAPAVTPETPAELAKTGAGATNEIVIGVIAGALVLGAAATLGAGALRRNALK